MVSEGRFAVLEDDPARHDHYALCYESRREQLETVVPFLRRGIERGDRVVYATAALAPAEICRALRDVGVDVAAARSSGVLTFLDVNEVYCTDGEFDREGALDRIESLVAEAVDDGYEAFRMAAEMTCLLSEQADLEFLLEYEAEIDRRIDGTDLVGLCQYDRRAVADDVLQAVTRHHPQLAARGTVGHNAIYDPQPESADQPTASLDEQLERHRRRVAGGTSHEGSERGIGALARVGEELLWADGDAIPEVVASATLAATGCDVASVWQYDHDADALECRSRACSEMASADLRTVDGDRPTPHGDPRTRDGHGRTLDGGRRTLDGSQRTLDGSQRTLDGSQRTLDGYRRTLDDDRVVPEDDRRTFASLARDAFHDNEEQRWRDGKSVGGGSVGGDRSVDDVGNVGSGSVRDGVTDGTAGDGPASSVAGDLSAAAALPLAGTGALVVGTTGRIDRGCLEVCRALAGVASVAFEKCRQDRRLEERREEAACLDTVVSLLGALLDQSVAAACRRDVERALCETVGQVDDVALAWVGSVDAETGTATPRAAVGADWAEAVDVSGDGAVDRIPAPVEEGHTPQPIVDAVRTGEATLVDRIAEERPDGEWRQSALEHGYRSLLAIPLVYQEVTYGVATIYASRSNAFDGRLTDPLTDAGRFVGSLLNLFEREVALRTRTPRELEIELTSSAFPFVELADRLDCTIEVDDLVPHADHEVVAVGRLPDEAAERVDSVAAEADRITDASVVEAAAGKVLLNVTTDRPFVGATLSDRGAPITSLTAEPDVARLVVESTESIDERAVLAVLEDRYSDPSLVATRRVEDSAASSRLSSTVGEQLTDRQRQVATVAYHAGYFDTPRACTGEEVASLLDISPQAFYQHVRRMEQTLFDSVVDGSAGG